MVWSQVFPLDSSCLQSVTFKLGSANCCLFMFIEFVTKQNNNKQHNVKNKHYIALTCIRKWQQEEFPIDNYPIRLRNYLTRLSLSDEPVLKIPFFPVGSPTTGFHFSLSQHHTTCKFTSSFQEWHNQWCHQNDVTAALCCQLPTQTNTTLILTLKWPI